MVAQAYTDQEFKTPAEYLAAERRAETKSEYINGRIYAMAGASRAHNTLSMNVGGLLHAQLRGKSCEAFSQDLRVRVSETGLYTYPDVLVTCDPAHFDEQEDTLLNPTVIIEVLSPTTAAYDRGEKFAHYRRLASLTDYILIEQDQMRMEHFHRQPNGDWLLHVAEQPEDALTIESIGCRLLVSDVYERVPLPMEWVPALGPSHEGAG